MDSMNVLFDRMGERDKAQWVGGEWAEKMGNRLVWTTERCDVNLQYCLSAGWTLLKEEEKEGEIETEKWMLAEKDTNACVRYDDCCGFNSRPSDIMDRKSFLRWVGKMPNKKNTWPAEEWRLWFDESGDWHYRYDPEKGYTKKVFADYAEMQVEK